MRTRRQFAALLAFPFFGARGQGVSSRNVRAAPSLLRDDVSGNGHWLKVKLEGVKSNRGAVGARVTARYGGKVQAQEVVSQSGFYSANDSRLHFGLGAATNADLAIRWPNGNTEQVNQVDAGQLVFVREGSGIVKRISSSRR